MKPTVLHYTGSARDGGGIHAVVRSLAAAGGFRCILGVNPRLEQRYSPRLHLWRGPALNADRIGPVTAWRALGVAWRVRRWLRRGPHRIFHGRSRAGLLVVMWLRLLGARRAVATVHAFGRQRWFYRLAARWLKGRVYWLGPAMMAHYRIGGRDWSACLPDCVPPSARRPLKTRVLGRPLIFGCAGALVPVKNWELVVRAVATIPPEVAVRVVHAGGEDGTAASAAYAARLRRESEEPGIAGRIEWRGVVTDMGAFFDEINCLIVPSRWEASSVAALEAIATGVPVLASGASGTRDLVERCQGGWLFPADSAEALGQRMMALSRGSDLSTWRRNEAGLDEFTAPRSAEAHAAAYRSLIER